MRFWQIFIIIVSCFGLGLGFAQEVELQNQSNQDDVEQLDEECFNFEIPIEYQQVTKQEFDQILTSDGAQEFSDQFTYHNAYRIRITGPVIPDSLVSVGLYVGLYYQPILARCSNTTDEKTAIMQNGSKEGFVFNASNTDTWLDIEKTYRYLENSIHVDFSAIEQNEEPIELDIWVCQIPSVGNQIRGYYVDRPDGASISIQAYRITDAHCTEEINNHDIDHIGLDRLLTENGLEEFKHLFTQKHIYRISMSGPMDDYAGGSTTKLHFNQSVPVLIGRASIDLDGFYESVEIGSNESGFIYLSDEDDTYWKDYTQYCGSSTMYVGLSGDWQMHTSASFRFWIGLDESLGSHLIHEQFSSGLTGISISGYNLVSDQPYASTLEFGYDPVSQNELQGLLNDDNAGDYIQSLKQPYLYHLELINRVDTDKPVKMKMGMEIAPVSAIGKGSGTTSPQAAIGDAITNQHNVDMENWENLTTICNADTLFSILSNTPGSQKASKLSLWFGFDEQPGYNVFYENLDGYYLPNAIDVNAYRVVEKQPIPLISINDTMHCELECLQEGDKYNTDRPYYIESIPDSLKGLVWLKTPYNVLDSNPDSLLTVKVKGAGTVYIVFLKYYWVLPDWMRNGLVQTPYKMYLSKSNSYFTVFKRQVTPGELVLGDYLEAGSRFPYILLFDIEQSPPIADFTYQPETGRAPITLQFMDQSTGYIESWNWDFGDGKSSTEKNPGHTYVLPDTYYVTLTVSSTQGTDSKTDTIYIKDSSLIAEFSTDTTSGVNPLTVQFTDESTGSINSWSWDFGDGTTSAEQNPVHQYTTADTFDVTLTVSGPDRSDQIVKEDYIIVFDPAPIAGFTADVTEGAVPLIVQFSDTSSGEINFWFWDFGDGNFSTKQHPQHQYSLVDTFTVTLRVSGPTGISSVSKTDYIKLSYNTGIAGMSEQPTSFALYGNYPNPFNPVTNITFDVPRAQHVTLSIYNVNGSLVETLVDEYKSPGRYTINWQAGHHSSGMYFIRMVTEGYSKIQKCILLK